MTKQHKKPTSVATAVETVENAVDEVVEATTQAVETEETFAETAQVQTASNENKEPNVQEKSVEPPVKQEKSKKSGATALALLALLVALGIGGAGHYFANSKFAKVESQLQALSKGVAQAQTGTQSTPELPSFEAEKAQLSQLNTDYQKALARIAQLESEQQSYTQKINALQAQMQKLGGSSVNESTTWRYSEADFLLNNALRKVVLDNDIDTAKSLLIEADNVLSQISDSKVLAVREALKADLDQLSRVNQVDQSNLMQRLAGLANLVDDMQLAVNDGQMEESSEVSDSLEDWQKNLEKSADSFLSHFIRVSDKANLAHEKAFIAPNQEIYLRENIRLRLQIAMMAVPRQQNELYKQSVEAVASWVRSYFDVENSNVKRFLKEIDDLAEQSIYIDAPSRLQSLDLLSSQLNRSNKPIGKIQLEEEKSLAPVKDDVPVEAAPSSAQ